MDFYKRVLLTFYLNIFLSSLQDLAQMGLPNAPYLYLRRWLISRGNGLQLRVAGCDSQSSLHRVNLKLALFSLGVRSARGRILELKGGFGIFLLKFVKNYDIIFI